MAKTENIKSTFVFQGFDSPQFTQVPDVVFDELLAELTESELKVLLYIIRRTFGFKKNADTISLKQLSEGIVTRDGRQLDRGAGVSKASAARGVKGLVEKNIITTVRNRGLDKSDAPTTYQLAFRKKSTQNQVSQIATRGGTNLRQGGVSNRDTQETVEQQTEIQERAFEDSKQPTFIFDEERAAISEVVRDFARQLGDTAPLPSTVSRAVNLYRQYGWELEPFLDALYEARRITQERSASIKTQASGNGWGPRPKISYFFAVAEDLLKGE